MTNPLSKIVRIYQPRDCFRLLAMMLAYPVLHLASLKISTYQNVGDLIWLPGGMALGYLLLFGLRQWLGIYLGALAGAFLAHDPWPVGLVTALGNTLGPVTGAFLLSRLTHFDNQLKRTRDISLLIFCGGLIGALVGALIGAPAFAFASGIPYEKFPHLFLDWWMSDFIGVVTFTPLMLMIVSRPARTSLMLQRPKETVALLASVIAVIATTQSQYIYLFSRSDGVLLLVLFFIWAAARLGQRGTAITAVVIYMFSILATHEFMRDTHSHLQYGWDLWLIGVVMTLCSQFIAVMFNERDRIAQKLRDSEERHRLSQLYGGIGAWESDLIQKKQFWSENCSQIMGFPATKNPSWADFLKVIIPEDRHKVMDATKNHLELGIPYDVTYRIQGKKGDIRWMRSVGQTERDSRGMPVRMRGIVEDITSQIMLYNALHESETRYKNLMDKARDTILVANMEGHLEQINLAGEHLLGYTKDEIHGLTVMDIHPESELPKIREHFGSVTTGNTTPLETKVLSKSGKIIDIEVRPSLVEINGVQHPEAIFIDLTDRKRAEAERLAQEKSHREALIREVHHRIKNNLQGITGVLRLFAEKHPATATPITEAIGQVQSIALIHGIKMNLGTDPINLCTLIKPIANNNQVLWKSPILYRTPPCKTDACESAGSMGCHLMINENEAVPLALILNELITNAVKHGQPASPVELELEIQAASKTPTIHITNQGSLGEAFDFDQRKGLGTGLQLVTTLLPSQGVKLSWQQQKNSVITSLELSSPVII